MKQEIVERVVLLSEYVCENEATIREAGERFGIRKSTVHIDLSKRLKKIDKKMFEKIKKILEKNFTEKHIRGGEATRKKYLEKNISFQEKQRERNN